MNAPRVLFLIDEVEGKTAGGTERQLFQTIALLSGSGFHVELAILRGGDWLTPAIAGCPVHLLKLPVKLKSPSGLASLVKLRGWMRSQHFDIVQTFFSDANLVGPIAAKLAGVRVVIGSRRNLNHSMTPSFAYAQRFANRFSDRLLANSEMVKSAVCKSEHADPSKLDVIHNGIQITRFARDPGARLRIRTELQFTDEHILVGNVANLRAIKGVPDLVEAAALAVETLPQLRFVQVGEGPLRDGIASRLAQLNLRDRFLLLGHRDDVHELLSAFDIAVLTSRAEGFSNSVLEYMAAALPVIATDVGGNAEALADTGILVRPGDAEAIAQALVELGTDPVLRISLGSAALERVSEHFSLERTQTKIVGYYRALLDRKPGASNS